MNQKIYIYKGYERLWHWSQALLVILLMYTGLEIHGVIDTIGYEQAISIHNTTFWLFLILTAFTIFWHFTTGEWKQYIPTTKFMREMIRFYVSGIFKGEPHPTKKTQVSKLNPLQRWTYLFLKILIFPVQIISGLAYHYYNDLQAAGIDISLDIIAFVHTMAAYVIIVFFIMHVYLTTTGHTVFSNIKAMITGWETMHEADEATSLPKTAPKN